MADKKIQPASANRKRQGSLLFQLLIRTIIDATAPTKLSPKAENFESMVYVLMMNALFVCRYTGGLFIRNRRLPR